MSPERPPVSIHLYSALFHGSMMHRRPAQGARTFLNFGRDFTKPGEKPFSFRKIAHATRKKSSQQHLAVGRENLIFFCSLDNQRFKTSPPLLYIFPRFEAGLSGRGVSVNRNDSLARIYEYRTVCQGFWKNFPSCPIDFPCLFMFWFLPPSFSGGKFGSSNDFHCQTGRNVVSNSRRKNKTKAR